MIPPGNLWEQTAQEHFSAPSLDDALHADIAIVGGGYTGCSAALAAAEGGARVVLLEAETVGHGGSGRNVGLVNAGLWLPPEAVVKRLGPEYGARLNTALGQGPDLVFDLIARHAISCEARRSGTLHCAHAPRAMTDLAERQRQWQAQGGGLDLLDARESRLRTGSPEVHGALFDSRAGTIQPLSYLRGLARAAVKNGAQVFEKSPVSSLKRSGEAWRLTTPQGEVAVDQVLLATNAYHRPFAGANPAGTAAVHYFQVASEPIVNNDILPGGEGCWNTAAIMTSFRRDAAGRLIVGAMGLPDRGGHLHLSWMQRKLARLFPQAAHVSPCHQWFGRIAMTSDKIPKLVRIAPGLHALFGYSGRGIAPGTVMGQAVGLALATGNHAKIPLQTLDGYAEKFCDLRSVFYESAARAAHLIDR